MFIYQPNGRKTRIPFGNNTRGLRIDDLMLEYSDIKIMLGMREGELKDRLHAILCGMESSENFRYENRPRENEQAAAQKTYTRKILEQMAMSEKNRPRTHKDFNFFCEEDTTTQRKKSEYDELVWSEED